MLWTGPTRAARLHAPPDGPVVVELVDGEEGIATGQACVFYADNASGARILGGGFIAKALKPTPAGVLHDTATAMSAGEL